MSLMQPPTAPEAPAPGLADPKPTPASPRPAAAATRPRPIGSVFRVVWRWHFYAGMIVAPVMVTLSVTGGLYIFRSEITGLARRDLMEVPAGSSRVGPQAQVDAALASHPGASPVRLQLHPDPTRTTLVTLRPRPAGRPAATSAPEAGPARQVEVFVDPATGRVVGQLDGTTRLDAFFNETLRFHRTLWVGTTGRIVTELATCWGLVLTATGLYLWWPKPRARRAGVWTVRWWAKLYTQLRDWHTLAGLYLAPVLLVIMTTGLYYTYATGAGYRFAAKRVEEALKPAESPAVEPPTKGKRLPLDDLLAPVRDQYPDRVLVATLGESGSRRGGARKPAAANGASLMVTASRSRNFGPFVATTLTIDRASGRIVRREENLRSAAVLGAWAFPLHVGSVGGLATKFAWLVACVVLTVLPVTGLLMWWKRRPRGTAGLPRRPEIPLPRWLIGAAVALCAILPAVGASVLLILAGEGIYRLGRWRRRPTLMAR